MCKGREWDFVFDVDIEDGAPMRQLATDRGENPYIAADRFIAEEGLPAYFREQIVQFITQNTGAAAPPPSFEGMSVTGGGFDPLTGATLPFSVCCLCSLQGHRLI